MTTITTQKACSLAKRLVKTVYKGYFEHTPIQLAASCVGDRLYRRCKILTVEVKERYIDMVPVKVEIWLRGGKPHGEIVAYSPHYDFLEPASVATYVLINGGWCPIRNAELIAGRKRVGIPVRKASQAVRRFLKDVTGRKDWHTRFMRRNKGGYPRFMAYTKANKGKDAPKVELVVKEGLQVVIASFSQAAYPSITKGIRAERMRNGRRDKRPLKRSVATATAKAFVCKLMNVDRKHVKGKSARVSDDKTSIVVNIYVGKSLSPLPVRVTKKGGKVSAKLEGVEPSIVML